jgi:hypothetical protein
LVYREAGGSTFLDRLTAVDLFIYSACMLSRIAIVVTGLALAAMAQTGAKDFVLRLETVPTGPRELRMTVTTDLPEGAIIHLGVKRDYDETLTDKYLPKKVQTASGTIFRQYLPVQGGKVQAKVSVDDRRWVAERNALAERMAPAGMMFSRLRNIRPGVEIFALFTPLNSKQPGSVLKVTGSKGELIKNGNQPFGSFKTLQTTKTFAIPFNGGS